MYSKLLALRWVQVASDEALTIGPQPKNFLSLIRKSKDKAFEVFEIKEFTLVNDCFKNKSNAVFDL